MLDFHYRQRYLVGSFPLDHLLVLDGTRLKDGKYVRVDPHNALSEN